MYTIIINAYKQNLYVLSVDQAVAQTWARETASFCEHLIIFLIKSIIEPDTYEDKKENKVYTLLSALFNTLMWHQYRVFISIYRQTSQMAAYCNTRLPFRVRSLYAYCSPLTCLCPAERPRGRFPKDPSGLSPGFSSYLRMIKNPYLIIYVWDCVLHCLRELKGSVYWALLTSSWWQLPL
jgi:hypothetical protein